MKHVEVIGPRCRHSASVPPPGRGRLLLLIFTPQALKCTLDRRHQLITEKCPSNYPKTPQGGYIFLSTMRINFPALKLFSESDRRIKKMDFVLLKNHKQGFNKAIFPICDILMDYLQL